MPTDGKTQEGAVPAAPSGASPLSEGGAPVSGQGDLGKHLEEFGRRFQGSLDKSLSALEKKVEGRIKALEEAKASGGGTNPIPQGSYAQQAPQYSPQEQALYQSWANMGMPPFEAHNRIMTMRSQEAYPNLVGQIQQLTQYQREQMEWQQRQREADTKARLFSRLGLDPVEDSVDPDTSGEDLVAQVAEAVRKKAERGFEAKVADFQKQLDELKAGHQKQLEELGVGDVLGAGVEVAAEGIAGRKKQILAEIKALEGSDNLQAVLRLQRELAALQARE